MKVGVIGGTGFIGSYLIDELLEFGMQPVVLVRPGSDSRLRHAVECEVVTGDLNDSDAVMRLVRSVDAMIYNVGILREFPSRGITFNRLQYEAPKHVIDAALQAGVSNFLLMSANGIRPDGTTYQRSKYSADSYLAQSGMDYSIFRPSVVFGDPRGRMEFATQLCRDIINVPLPAPLFFNGLNAANAGKFELSPVHVKDVARAFVNQLAAPLESNRIFHLGGPDILTWKDILKTIASAVGKDKLMLPVPVQGVRLAATLLDRFESFPITRDQITMLMESNVCAAEDLNSMGIIPRPFNDEELGYLGEVMDIRSHSDGSGRAGEMSGQRS